MTEIRLQDLLPALARDARRIELEIEQAEREGKDTHELNDQRRKHGYNWLTNRIHEECGEDMFDIERFAERRAGMRHRDDGDSALDARVIPQLRNLDRQGLAEKTARLFWEQQPDIAERCCIPRPGDEAAQKNAPQSAPAGVLPEPERSKEKRSWNQGEVDSEIRRLMSVHRQELARLGKAVKDDVPGASAAWRDLFGRNTLAKKLGCSGAMISRSRPWRAIAGPLGMTGRTPGAGRGQRSGFDVAADQAALERERELTRLEAEQEADQARDQRPRRRREQSA